LANIPSAQSAPGSCSSPEPPADRLLGRKKSDVVGNRVQNDQIHPRSTPSILARAQQTMHGSILG